jgi:hypothetical protein
VIKILRQLELLFPIVSGSSRAATKKRAPRKPRTKKVRSVSAWQPRATGEHRVGHDALRSGACASGGPHGRRTAKSDEFLFAVWQNLRQEFFPDHAHIDEYTVTWSSRPQKRVLASCNIRRRRIVVAQELFEPSAARWIAPVLYHEMCHAVIGEGVHLSQSGKRLWHGTQFRQLEARHPDIEAMNAWIATGGWAMAVRSHRARRAWRSRRGPR